MILRMVIHGGFWQFAQTQWHWLQETQMDTLPDRALCPLQRMVR